MVKNPIEMQETPVQSLGREEPWRRERLPTPVFLHFSCGSAGKESACNAGDLGSIPGLERSPRGGKGYPLQYSGLENSTDCIVHGVAKSRTRLTDFHFQNIHTTYIHTWLIHTYIQLNIQHGSTLPLLDKWKLNIHMEFNTWMFIFIAVLFSCKKLETQISINRWMNKLYFTHITQPYSAIKINHLLITEGYQSIPQLNILWPV